MEVHKAQTRRRWRPGRRWLIAVVVFCACAVAVAWWLATRNALPCVGVYEIGKWENPEEGCQIYKLPDGFICGNFNGGNDAPILISSHDWDGKIRWQATIPIDDPMAEEWIERGWNLSKDGHWLAAIIANGKQAEVLRWHDGEPLETVTLPLDKELAGKDYDFRMEVFKDGRVFISSTALPDSSIVLIDTDRLMVGRYHSHIPISLPAYTDIQITEGSGENNYMLERTASEADAKAMVAKYNEIFTLRVSSSHLLVKPISISSSSTISSRPISLPAWYTLEENEQFQIQLRSRYPPVHVSAPMRVKEKSTGNVWLVGDTEKSVYRHFLRKDGGVILLECPPSTEHNHHLLDLLTRIPKIRRIIEERRQTRTIAISVYKHQKPPIILGKLKYLIMFSNPILLHQGKQYSVKDEAISPDGRYLYTTGIRADDGNCYLLVYRLSKFR